MGDWKFPFAEADLSDWATVSAYSLSAIMCFQAARIAGMRLEMRDCAFWRVTAIVLLLLALNELLDLQTLLTFLGRAHAKATGWYDERRFVQYVFVLTLAVAALCSATGLLWRTRHSDGTVRLAVVGLIFIGLFVLLRAASFHHVEAIFSRGGADYTWGKMQEFAGIFIIAAAAALYPRKRVVQSPSK